MQRLRKIFTRTAQILLAVVLAVTVYGLYLLNVDQPERFSDPLTAFKYGSTGGEKNFGLPVSVWNVLPKMFPEYLPEGKEMLGYGAFGFLNEPRDQQVAQGVKTARPVGTSVRNVMGIDRIFLNCASCHSGQVNVNGEARIYVGMGSNLIDLLEFQKFFTEVALDPRFNGKDIVAEIEKHDLEKNILNRLALKLIGVNLIRDQLLQVRARLSYYHDQPEYGPGRFDTFSPAKALLNWPFDKLDPAERVGIASFPSVWLQEQRRGMQLHWDGNNQSLEERNRSAAFGTGANPTILDRRYLRQVETWLKDLEPPAFPGPIDAERAAAGEGIYARYCADCHGATGRDFTGDKVGTVIPIAEIGTDRARLDNYTYQLAVNQNQLYATFGKERFRHFRKTNGYAAAPLDGVWLRAPYLHNGSVPTLAALLTPPEARPKNFWRGTVTYDLEKVGFVYQTPDLTKADRRHAFCHLSDGTGSSFCGSKQPHNNGLCNAGKCLGNGNYGHRYGTELSAEQKLSLIEYLKGF